MINLVQNLIRSFAELFYVVINPNVMVLWLIIITIIVYHNHKYKKSTYYKITHNSYWKVRTDKGRYGEYLIYKRLKHLEKEGAKFLFNIYVPKENGDTTEIDVLLISLKGLLVFESKNYSGWIFGSENQKKWTQTLPQGRGRSHKEHFLNPIIQNKGHIKHLENLLEQDIDMKSVIVFSERCTLKGVSVNSQDIKVINRYDISSAVSELYGQQHGKCLDEKNIEAIYEKLYPFTQLDEIQKEKHIANIRKMHEPTIKVDELKLEAIDSGAETTEEINESVIAKSVEEEAREVTERKIVESTKKIVEDGERCPKCGNRLVMRTAKSGKYAGNQFWGCSSYPRCKFIRVINLDETSDSNEIL